MCTLGLLITITLSLIIRLTPKLKKIQSLIPYRTTKLPFKPKDLSPMSIRKLLKPINLQFMKKNLL